MTMAAFKYGKPVMAAGTPSVAYSAGDVLVFGGVPMVAHVDNPPFSPTVVEDALAVGGGIYTMAADAAYPVGQAVLWDTLKQQVTTTYRAGISVPFGYIVGGPTGQYGDGGPTAAGSLCDVLHQPRPSALSESASAQNPACFRNMIDGGDFTTNPFQRGTSGTGITSSLTYTADRFFMVGGASSSISWGATADTTLAGYSQSLKMQRASANSNTAALNLGQVLESADCIKAQGQIVTLSFYAKAGANYSGGALTVALNHSVTAGNDTAAHLVAASTNWQATPTVINATQVLTTSWTRYQFTGTVPALATQLGLLLTWTPTGTAGTDDSVYIQGVQLEVSNGASPFEHRDIEVELALCQRYYVRFVEVNGATFAIGVPTAANAQTYAIWLPTAMRSAPTVTVTVGGFKTNTDGAGNATPTGLASGTAHSPTIITLVTTLTQTAAAHVNALVGTGTTGFIDASADF